MNKCQVYYLDAVFHSKEFVLRLEIMYIYHMLHYWCFRLYLIHYFMKFFLRFEAKVVISFSESKREKLFMNKKVFNTENSICPFHVCSKKFI